MRLEPITTTPATPSDIPAALRGALRDRGHAPAVTVLTAQGRHEQGVASLAQWAAKGSHQLIDELTTGDHHAIRIALAPSWTLAAVCLAAWWVGIPVELVAPTREPLHPGVRVDIAHERHAGTVEAAFWVGDAFDGSPVATLDGEPWVVAVQPYPDSAPPATPADVALRSGSEIITGTTLLARAAQMGTGTAGIAADHPDPVALVAAIALRPLVAGRPTVVLDGVERDEATPEKVTTWL